MANPYTYNSSSSAGATSYTVAVPGSNPHVAGDMLVVNLWSAGTVTKVADTVGNSYLCVQQKNGLSQWVTVGKTKQVTGNITITNGSSVAGNAVVVGIPAANVWYGGVDAFAIATGTGTGPSVTSPALTYSGNATAIALWASAASAITAGGSYTALGTSHGSSPEFINTAWATVTAATTAAGTATSGAWAAAVLTVMAPIWTTGTPPVPPTQYAGQVAASADMNTLAKSALFLRRPPMAIAQATAGQSYTGGSQVAVNWGIMLRDTDGFFDSSNPSRLTVVTQGLYKCRYSIPFIVGSASAQCVIRVTTGANNPSGAGVASTWWYADAAAANSVDGCCVGGGVIPMLMYPADYVEVLINVGTTGTSPITPNVAQASLRMVSQ